MKKHSLFKQLGALLVLCMVTCGFIACEENAVMPQEDDQFIYQDDQFTCQIKGDSAAIVNYEGNETEVIVPDSINGKTVTAIEENAFSGTEITGISIPDSVKSIGEYAFAQCVRLEEIDIPHSVISIGEGAFSGCNNLIEVYIPISVTSVGAEIFMGCASLTEINCEAESQPDGWSSDWASENSATVRWDIGYEVSDAQFVYEIKRDTATITQYIGTKNVVDIPTDIDGKRVTAIGKYAFMQCAVTRITISDNIKSIGVGAFSGCDKLTKITIPNSVTAIEDRTFYDCSRLTEVSIPDSVTSIGEFAFESCTSLNIITIPDNIITIGQRAFENCTSLAEVIFPYSLTTIGEEAFKGCTGLTELFIPISVTTIGPRVFFNCTNLTTVYCEAESQPDGWHGWSTNWEDDDKIVYWDDGFRVEDDQYVYAIKKDTVKIVKYKGNETEVEIPDSFNGKPVTEIGYNAFSFYETLTKVIIPDSITKIGHTAFLHCAGLTELNLPDGLKSIDVQAFGGCTGLTEIIIPDSVTNIGDRIFIGCTELRAIYCQATSQPVDWHSDWKWGCEASVYWGEDSWDDTASFIYEIVGDTAIIVEYTGTAEVVVIPNYYNGIPVTAIGEKAFYDCNFLTKVTIPASVTDIGDYAFYSCSNLTEVTILGSITNLGDSAFEYCMYMRKVTVAGSITNIGDGAFMSCLNLTEFVLPDGVISIGENAFKDCASLKNVVIPDGVTSIGDSAFNGCFNLATITIPDSVTSIGRALFDLFCTNLTDIYCEADSKPDGWASNWMVNCPATVHWGYKG
ncbi:MAG: leucine-rich repeat domain-containing protein [Clostridia bacterium]|nr:leucine-rich repeat domain-containing protein [Clostridia bacterium]